MTTEQHYPESEVLPPVVATKQTGTGQEIEWRAYSFADAVSNLSDIAEMVVEGVGDVRKLVRDAYTEGYEAGHEGCCGVCALEKHVDAAWEKSHACSELKDYGG